VALIANSRNRKPGNKHGKVNSATRKAFDYIDAITNLMVRNGEVVAAVACGEHPGWGIISFNSSSENAQVRLQYTSYVSIAVPHTQPAPMDMEMELASEDSAGPYLQAATVANSKFYSAKNFERVPTKAWFTSLSSSDPDTSKLWVELEQCQPKAVVLWCDFDSLGLDVGLGPSKQKLPLKVT
jgi:hypothetical protein